MRLFAAMFAAIPAAIHLHDFNRIRFAAPMTFESWRRLQIMKLRQREPFFVVLNMTIVTQQNQVFDFVKSAFASHLKMMILKAAMIILLRTGRASANAATQTIAQINRKTRSVINAHFY